MTLLTTPTTPTTTTPAPSPSGAISAPNRQSRAHCWAARDTFFACLEQHGIIDSIKESERAGQVCGQEGKGLERECAASWVTYFKQRRVMEFQKRATLEKLAKEGAESLPEGMGLSGGQGAKSS